MRATQAGGRPRTQVVPSSWSEAPRRVMGKTRTAACTIRRPGGTQGTMNPVTGERPVTPNTPHFSGTARIQALATRDKSSLAAEQQVTSVGYLVTVDLCADDVAVDDLVHVVCLDANGDPTLEAYDLTVQSIARGTLAWERDLICSDELG